MNEKYHPRLDSPDLIDATESQKREYSDRHFERAWKLTSTEDALEILKEKEGLRNLRQMIWYQRIQEARKFDRSSGRGYNDHEKESKQKILEEMKRGWPSFEPGVTNGRIFEYVYSEGDKKNLDLYRDVVYYVETAVRDSEIAILPDEYAHIIVSRFGIDATKLNEIFNNCSKDFRKVVTALIALDLGIIKLEDISSGLDFDVLLRDLKKINPSIQTNFEILK